MTEKQGDKAVLSRDVPPSEGEVVSAKGVGMDDLTITRLCAEALGLPILDDFAGIKPPVAGVDVEASDGFRYRYNPLGHDAQAMALVKKFGMDILNSGGAWHVSTDTASQRGADLNRAIVECVAKMQKEKRHEPS